MGFVAATCPNCSAHLQIDETANSCYCSYCGTLVERERINLNVSGYVKLDQTGQQGNFQRLAEAAFSAGNYAEAYNYYAKILEISIDDAHAIFRKGLCAGFLSLNFGALRIIEILEGYSGSIALLGNDNSRKSQYTSEYMNLARKIALTYDKISGSAFESEALFNNFCNGYIVTLKNVNDMCSRVPLFLGKQREEFLSLVQYTCSFAARSYYYYSYANIGSGPPCKIETLQSLPKNIQSLAASINERCVSDFYALPHIQQRLSGIDSNIAFHQANIDDYQNTYNSFSLANPNYVSKIRNINIGGTLLVILITLFSCFIVILLGVAFTPVLLILEPILIIAACIIWKRLKAKKILELDIAVLPAELLDKRQKSAESGIALAAAKSERAALILK